MEKIFVFGAGGHAKVVIDIIERRGIYDISFLADDDPDLWGSNIYGYPVRGGKDGLLGLRESTGVTAGVVAIGSNNKRRSIAAWLAGNGFRLISAIHPSAQLARGVTVGAGTVIMAGAVVNSDAVIGENVIINTRASVDHDCIIGNCVHIAPGTTLCGTVIVGDGTFIGAGATILPNIAIGCNVVVGAGATVIEDVPNGVTVAGTPAKIVAG
jgi:sugar O-acyltransferase (sialic acid O-acetyltransferase NeuD family)